VTKSLKLIASSIGFTGPMKKASHMPSMAAFVNFFPWLAKVVSHLDVGGRPGGLAWAVRR